MDYPCNEIQHPLNHPLLSASSSSSAPKTCVGSRCGAISASRSLLHVHSRNTRKTHHKINSTIVASLERPARHTTDTLATPATTSMFACNLLVLINRPQDRKAAQGNPRKRRSPRGVSQSARPHGKDVQAMGWVVGGGWWADGASGALILVFPWQVELDYCSSLCPCEFGRLSGIVRPGSDVDDTKDWETPQTCV